MLANCVHTRRRPLLAALAGVAALTIAGIPAGGGAAETFPDHTINVVTHAGPGGGTDITTRMMMLRARSHLGQDMQVVNRSGGSGTASLLYASEQPRDGYTVLTITQSHIFQIIQGKVPFGIDELVGVARATDDPMVVAVPADSPIQTLDDLIAASKEREGGLKWGTTFAGGADHVAIHTFMKKAGDVPYTIVPFKGGGDIVTSLVGGNVEAAALNYAEGESQFTNGDLRPVVVLAEERMESLPDVPTAMEEGIDAQASTIRGFAVLKGVPEDRLKILEEGFVKSMQEPVYQTYLQSGGMPKSSVVGSEKWNQAIRRIYEDSRSALEELGML
jgi:putative tricarboxylic transport membrane protein